MKEYKEKCCGNCRYHNAYDYPNEIFCFARFEKRENPVVSVLYYCNEWESQIQKCFCLRDALKRKSN